MITTPVNETTSPGGFFIALTIKEDSESACSVLLLLERGRERI